MGKFYILVSSCCLVLFLVFFPPLFTEHASGNYAVWALITFKEAIFEDPILVMSNWNAIDADPCEWPGVSCSVARDHVVKM